MHQLHATGSVAFEGKPCSRSLGQLFTPTKAALEQGTVQVRKEQTAFTAFDKLHLITHDELHLKTKHVTFKCAYSTLHVIYCIFVFTPYCMSDATRKPLHDCALCLNK